MDNISQRVGFSMFFLHFTRTKTATYVYCRGSLEVCVFNSKEKVLFLMIFEAKININKVFK